jgi:hypothetical protein
MNISCNIYLFIHCAHCRGPVAVGNLDISTCKASGVVVDLPTAAHQVEMLYFSLHHNSGQSGAALKVVTGGATMHYMDMSN